jgi:hypothetical protein
MSVKINASTSSGLVVDSDLTGSLRLQTGGNDALTVDSSQVVNFTKQFQFGGALPPAFSAYAGTSTSCSNNTQTKLIFDTELFDTTNNFASSRFTPTAAGYYQFTANINFSSGSFIQLALRKNNIDQQYGSYPNTVTNQNLYVNSSFFAYANGTTDYFELYVFQSSGGTISNQAGQAYTYFTGFLARAA